MLICIQWQIVRAKLIRFTRRIKMMHRVTQVTLVSMFVCISLMLILSKTALHERTVRVFLPVYYTTNQSFWNELIVERMASHSSMYDDRKRECRRKRPTSDGENARYAEASRLLDTFSRTHIEYPQHYFSGRGIVLTVGMAQIPLAKVNLKMIEHSATRLPVQVEHRQRRRRRPGASNNARVPHLDLVFDVSSGA
jgi:hypothetical protein